jgi:hypothetical protein
MRIVAAHTANRRGICESALQDRCWAAPASSTNTPDTPTLHSTCSDATRQGGGRREEEEEFERV